MKIIIFAFVIIGCASTVTIEDQWKQYKVDFNRNYTDEEDLMRFELFKKKVQEIDEHNAKYEKGEVGYSMGINQFTDYKPEELEHRGLVIPDESVNPDEHQEDLKNQWEKFKLTHKRNFDEAEDAERYEIFKANVQKINEHNKKFENGEVSFSMQINQFSDRKPEEKGHILGVVKN